ncbi:FecCD family ABC transporter permease [Pseudonocardia sulfidoxydans]|uniref:FecCD family ABC transporter permease n=1 Tax=Pseudonocardia sulfidoxydans TaxID=54011 RepID=UPI0036079ED5
MTAAPGTTVTGAAAPRPAGRWRLLVLLAAVVALGVLVVASVALGSSGVGFADAAWAIGARILGSDVTPDGERVQAVVWGLRLPRVVLAVLGGAALSVAGVVMQGMLRNPMVSPFTLGISSAAAFGASVVILFGGAASAGGRTDPLVVAGALIASAGCAALLLGLSWIRRAAAVTLILVGMALNYLFSAVTAALQYVATDQQLAQIVRWTFGSVNEADWTQVAVVGCVAAVAFPLVMARAGALDAVAFAGDDAARGLGVDVTGLRIVGSITAVALAAVVVSFTGVIAFVGLVGPHIARLIIGAGHRYLVPFAAVSGALLLLAADTVGRTVFAPVVIPVGIVVSFLGAPLFLNLVLARKRSFL